MKILDPRVRPAAAGRLPTGVVARAASLALLGALAVVAAPAHAQDGVRMNRTIELLESGRPAFGVLSFDYSLVSARTLASSDLDFIIIDMEHAPYDVERLHMFLLGMTNKRLIAEKGNLQPNVVPFVRVPATGPEEVLFQAKQVLDVGVFGVMYPSISTREEAEHAVAATRYPQRRGAGDFEPAGLRGRNPTNAMWLWGTRDYMDRADVWPLDPRGELLAIIQIETVEGVENIEEIVSVPGVGVIFIGPSDLTASLGFPPGDEVEAAIQRVLAACLDSGVPCAITTGAGTVAQRIEEGFRFVTVGTDSGISAGVSAAIERGHAAGGR